MSCQFESIAHMTGYRRPPAGPLISGQDSPQRASTIHQPAPAYPPSVINRASHWNSGYPSPPPTLSPPSPVAQHQAMPSPPPPSPPQPGPGSQQQPHLGLRGGRVARDTRAEDDALVGILSLKFGSTQRLPDELTTPELRTAIEYMVRWSPEGEDDEFVQMLRSVLIDRETEEEERMNAEERERDSEDEGDDDEEAEEEMEDAGVEVL